MIIIRNVTYSCEVILINNFNNSLCHHFVEEANEIWYLRRLMIALPGYQISLTSCERLKERV